MGGILWILYYVFDVAYGAVEQYTNYHVENAPGLRITGPAYFGGVVFVGIALAGIYLRLNNQYKSLAIPAVALAGVCTLAAGFGLAGTVVSLLRFDFPQALFGFVGPSVLPMFISAVLLSIASLKAQSLPKKQAYLLLIFGLTHFPLGIGLWRLLTDVIPGFWYNELHFFISGFYWISIGKSLYKTEVRQPAIF